MTEIRITGGVDTIYRVWVDDEEILRTDDAEEAQAEALEQRAQRSLEARVERIEFALTLLVSGHPCIGQTQRNAVFAAAPIEIQEEVDKLLHREAERRSAAGT